MISIKTTPKLNGITIQGDFDDLNNLYEAISDYTTFYIDGILNEIESEYVKEHGVAIKDMTTEQRDTFFQLNQSEIRFSFCIITFEITSSSRNRVLRNRLSSFG